ncbi:MAG: MFS transporter [Alphaproteobacteria bacterium]|nr:MFS transporter [Alphaproteobacteria bacterium]
MKRAEGAAFVATLGALLAMTAASNDIMVPAQPPIARAFGMPEAAGAAMVGMFSVGFGFGLAVWGPLSDRFGRLPPLYAAAAGYILAGAVCALTDSFGVLLAGRFVQGFMGGVGPTLARAISRDLGGGARTAQALSAATVVQGAAPVFAPLLASGLLVAADWRGIFWALVVFGLAVILSVMLFVPETLPPEKREAPSIRQMGRETRVLMVTPGFLYGTAMVMTVFFGYMALLGMGAAVTESAYGLPPEWFGPLFAVNSVAYVLGALAANRLAGRFGVSTIIRAGALTAGASGVFLLALSAVAPPLIVLWTGVVIYVFAFGTLLALCAARGLEPAGAVAGTAASIMGLAQTLFSAAGAFAAAGLFDGSHRSLCWVMGVSGVMLLVLWAKGRRYL